MKTQKTLLAVLFLPAILFGAMKFYEVVPYKNHIATAPGDPPGISQTFINVVDSLEKVSIWVGDVGNGARYFVEIRDLEDNVIASGDSSPGSRSWAWLDILLEAHPTNKPVRGRTYKAVFTRAGGAPISYAYDPTNPYPYGNLTAPGIPDTSDLVARVYGVNNIITPHWFDSSPFIVSSFV